ncbi:MAG: EamA family transporter [Anaerolineales bacterium]|nr:MAG: EamA family transporter [Anaerolineales bacterium]
MKPRAWAALIAVYIVWGSTYLAIRFTIETIPPFISAGIRFLISGLILFIWRRLSGDQAPSKIEWRAATIVGLLLLLGGNGALVWAEQRIPSGIASLFIATTPLWMVLIDSLRPGGKNASWLTWAGVFVGLLGIALLANPWQQHTTSSPPLDIVGIVALLFGAFSWSIGSLYSRSAPLPKSPLMGTGMEMLAGSLGLFAFATLIGEWKQFDVSTISLSSIGGLTYLIIFGSGIGFVAYTWLLRNAPTTIVATYAYVNPVVAILLGSLIAHEPLEQVELIAAMIIISGVVLITTGRTLTEKKLDSVPLTPGED